MALSNGRILKAFRVRRGVLQRDLAAALHVHENRLGEIENGHRTYDRAFADRYKAAVNELSKGGN